MAASPTVPAGGPAGADAYRHPIRTQPFLFRAPPLPVATGLIAIASAAAAALMWFPGTSPALFLERWGVVFLVPALLAAGATIPLAAAGGGRFEPKRSFLLALTVLVVQLPILAVGRLAIALVPAFSGGVALTLLFAQGPSLWFRHLNLFGVSRPSHLRSLPVALVQPVLAILGVFLVYAPTVGLLAVTAGFLLLAFLCAAFLLRAADRPLRREFQVSGVSLIRPMLDHVNRRDPQATEALEAFFREHSIPADLDVRLVAFQASQGAKATVALPTVHPGPFASLGASDLPRKLEEKLGPGAGTVFVPHTPCDHDLDLPTGAEVDRVGEACRELLGRLDAPKSRRASPLVLPYAGSFARAQLLGDVALVVVTQAPQATDDIAYSVADRIVRELRTDGGPAVALIDAHNSYVEDQGDVTYGTPAAEKLIADARAAFEKAVAEARDGPIEAGTAVRTGYQIGRDGIGPEGIRALVVRAGGTTTAYVQIDGNNLVLGMREEILRALASLVDAAEVATTDNHVVHEVDGGINPVGERYPVAALARDAQEVVRQALADLSPVEVRTAGARIPSVRVLGPSFTSRLLTSLGDTLSMFTNALLLTFLVLLLGSLVLVAALL